MNNGRLAICVPSRGRPLIFARFVESWAVNSSGVSDILLRNGAADPDAPRYETFATIPGVIRTLGPDEGFDTNWTGTAGYGPAQQDLYERFPDYAAYLCIEDDTVLHTPGFDAWLLKEFDNFPGRVGMVELVDRAQQVHCQCFSAEWCRAIGALNIPAVGETAFEVALTIAAPEYLRTGHGAQFTHFPCVRHYGYDGNERAGAMEKGNEEPVARYHKKLDWVYTEWLPAHYLRLRQALAKAAGR